MIEHSLEVIVGLFVNLSAAWIFTAVGLVIVGDFALLIMNLFLGTVCLSAALIINESKYEHNYN